MSVRRRVPIYPAGASLFDPSTIGSIYGYWEADSFGLADDATITSTPWADKSGLGHHLTYSGGSDISTYQTNELNGEPIVRMPGGRSWDIPTSISSWTAGELLIVWKNQTVQGPGGHWFGNSDNDHYTFVGDSKIYSAFGTSARKDSKTPAVSVQTWHCMNVWSAPSDWAMYQNGLSVFSTSSNSVNFAGTPRFFRNSSDVSWQGDVAAMYLFSAKLSSPERDSMESRITAKYGITFA